MLHLTPVQALPLSITTEFTASPPPPEINFYTLRSHCRLEEDICTVSIKSNQVWGSVPVMVAGIQNSPNGAVAAVCVSVLRLLMCVICTVALSLRHITFFTQWMVNKFPSNVILSCPFSHFAP